jgi:hypothetical protein
MGRGHQANINLLRLVAAQLFKFSLLQGAEEFELELERDISDFIEKQRALICQFQSADFLCDRAREGAPLMPE